MKKTIRFLVGIPAFLSVAACGVENLTPDPISSAADTRYDEIRADAEENGGAAVRVSGSEESVLSITSGPLKGLKVVIPAGALPASVNDAALSATHIESPDVSGNEDAAAGPGAEISLRDLEDAAAEVELLQPATVTLPHTAPEGSEAYVGHFTGGKWVVLADGSANKTTATGTTASFSPFIVFAKAASETAAPSIVSVTPSQGRAGDSVVITGTNFGTQAGGTVNFGAKAATVSAWSEAEITVSVPPGLAVGIASLTVTAGELTSAAFSFEVLADIIVSDPPVLTSMTPVSGAADTVVTLTGTDFGATQGASVLRFNGGSITPLSWSDTQITFTVPLLGEGDYDVEVVVDDLTSNALSFAVPPAPPMPFISSVSNSGPEMYETISVSGTNFGAEQGTSVVKVDSTVAQVVAWSDTSITFVVPYFDIGGVRTLTVRVAGQTSNDYWLYMFNVPPTPGITALNPTSGVVGTSVQVSGTDFGASQGTSVLRIGSTVVSPASWTNTLIVFHVPATFTTGDYNVAVTRGMRTSNSTAFTVTPTLPSIALVVPPSGLAGATVTLSGVGFGDSQGASTLTIGGQNAIVTSWTAGQIVATVPAALAAGDAPIIVTVESLASNSANFEVRATGISGISPAAGKAGDLVTISGLGFGAAETDVSVSFGGVEGAVQSWSDTSIVVAVPAEAMPGEIPLRLRLGALLTNEVLFTMSRPWIDDATPRTVATGASLTLTGRGFGETQGTVTIDGASATIQGWSDTAVQVEVPAGAAAGLQDVALSTNDARQSNRLQVHVEGSEVWWVEKEPMARSEHTAVWTGTEMIIWGGGVKNIGTQLKTGARYNPATDTWVATSQVDAPAARVYAAAVWTGKEMIVTGGRLMGGTSTAAGRYNPATDSWTLSSTTNAPTNQDWPTAVWTGKEMIVWGGGPTARKTGARYNPETDTWIATALPPAEWTYFERTDHVAVWTGKEMLIWGGKNNTYTTGLASGGKYNPETDSWTPMTTTNVPSARHSVKAVWTGKEMVVWGGVSGSSSYLGTGGRYNPATDSWTSISATNAPSARWRYTMVWSGSEVLVWGGQTNTSTFFADGKRYRPASDSWADMTTADAPLARYLHTAVWTGKEMIVWGGFIKLASNIYAADDTGGRYDPAQNAWTPIGRRAAPSQRMGHVMVWTGSEIIVWGGFGIAWTGSPERNDGARYNPATDTWVPVAANTVYYGNPLSGQGKSAVWTGEQMVIWGQQGGGRYDPATDTWATMQTENAPFQRSYPSVVWTGTEAIFWGGAGSGDGGRYNPNTDTWASVSMTGAPTGREKHAAVWTGTEMIIWGGSNLGDGARYNPTSDMWTPVTTANAPTPRNYATAAWIGNAMLIWGGQAIPTSNTGGLYYPDSDTWSTLPISGAPSARFQQKSVWTGTEIIVWGGADGTNTFHDGGIYNPATETWTPIASSPAPEVYWDWYSRAPAVWTGDSFAIFTGSVLQMYRR